MMAVRKQDQASPRELEELERQRKLDDAGTAPDPGPNAEISRESPSGQPGDTHKTRIRPSPGAP
jgi:hypothetical protein